MNVKTTLQAQAPASRTRRQKVEDREHAIISGAADLFNSKGYAKTTIADIAAASGVADGTVYLYFKNKEALANSVLSRFYNDLTIQAQSGVDELSSCRERLHFLARHHLTQVIEHWRILEILPLMNMSVEHYGGSDLYHMNKAYTAVFDRVAKDGRAQGHIADHVPLWVLRDQFFGAMDYGFKTIMMRGSGAADVDAFAGGLMELIFTPKRAVTPEDGSPVARLEGAAARLEAAAARLENKANKE